MHPPERIDGARVLEWAWSNVPFGVVPVEGAEAIAIHGLALCQYDGKTRVYRFSCNREWGCEQDGLYDSLEEAKRELPGQYRRVPVVWRRVNE